MPRPVIAGCLTFAGNLAMRRVEFPEVGDYLPGHEHYWAHVTFVVQGAVLFHRTDAPEPDRLVRAPGFIETEAASQHTQTAREPGTVSYCIFAIRDEFGVVLQADEIEPADLHQEARFAG
jgi:quercetin dioxygenase-like cupin family protein